MSQESVFRIELRGTRYFVHTDEYKHLTKVLRKSVGDEIIVIDGFGTGFLCKIEENTGEDSLSVSILETLPEYGEHNFHIVCFLGMLHKRDRLEWFVEKAVELGSNHIILKECKYSEKQNVSESRINKIMWSALKQSKRSRLPKLSILGVNENWSWSDGLDLKLIATCASNQKRLPVSQVLQGTIQSIGLAIGPEGDFSEREIEDAIDSGFVSVSLGVNRLRSESAALYMLSTVKLYLGY